jgi:hypothetical protein
MDMPVVQAPVAARYHPSILSCIGRDPCHMELILLHTGTTVFNVDNLDVI